MVSIEAFSELLQVLYSAPLQHDQWQSFLTLVSEHTASRNGFFLSADTRTGLAVLAQGGKPQEASDVSDYNKKYAPTDPCRDALIRYARKSDPVGVFTDEELLPGEGLVRTDFYREMLARVNLRHATAVVLALSVRRFDVISVWRSPDEGPIADDSKRLLQLLIPHVQTALEIRRVLGLTEQRLASAEAMANASPTATFVLTQKGRVRHWNSAAESMIRAGDGFAMSDGYLAARDGRSNRALAKLLLDVASPAYSLSGSQQPRYLSVNRGSGKRPFQVLATPLPETHRVGSNADLLLLVTDPEKPSNFPDDLLHAIYDLTPSETEVANGLLMGYSLNEIACLRRVSTSTVRQQVKTMLSKTGTNRQSDMVRLFMTLPQAPEQSN
jgi:DNA-binding CsgD family transcriptional regulator